MSEQYDIMFLIIAKSAFLFWLVCNLIPLLMESFSRALSSIKEVLPEIMHEQTGV